MVSAVAELTLMLRSPTLADGLFPRTQSKDLICGVSEWLGAEENALKLEDTVDMVLGRAEGEDENE